MANGAKVAKYSPGFLTTVSSTGTSSVVITPTEIGGAWYALALVTSHETPYANHNTEITISAVSAGSSAKSETPLPNLPTPVVLVHGLWGNWNSLISTRAYLLDAEASDSFSYAITPICYSVYLAFDASNDALPGHGSGCEVTSAQALDKYLTTLYAQLDADHYVGGRVDAVVHSMGGLVARHFTAVSGYESVRNRMLGVFRNVVTLDTPETGSALATYLDDTAYNRSFQGSILSDEYLLWVSFCGSTSTTIETCFDDNGLPLSYPGKPLNTGAVYSLIPGGTSVTLAPSPDAFNTSYGKWYAVASNFKDGDQPPALLRDVLNTVIAATYPSSQTPPTVDSILGTPDSDVVVTLASQTSTAVAAQTKEFKDLEHTPAPLSSADATILGFGGDTNNSVVDSANVNAQVAYWLGLQSSATPAEEENAKIARPTRQVAARFPAPGRLSVSVPAQAAGLGQPVEITLKVSRPKVAEVAIDQLDPVTGATLGNLESGKAVASGRAEIVNEEAGAITISLTPLQTGTITLKASVLFADGGLAHTEFKLTVAPSARGLNHFELNNGFKVIALVLDDNEQDRQAYLFPSVQYDRLQYPIYLDNSESLHLSVDQPEDDPVIRVDSNGLVHALRPGSATITGDFDGVTDSVRIDVYSQQDAPAGYRSDN
jgi:pimeloyl-ACP methyl ester carboxylesterase